MVKFGHIVFGGGGDRPERLFGDRAAEVFEGVAFGFGESGGFGIEFAENINDLFPFSKCFFVAAFNLR